MQFQVIELWKCFVSGIHHLPATLLLTLIPVSVGMILGTLISLARIFKVPVLGKLLAVIITLYSGVPLVVSMLIFNLFYLTRSAALPSWLSGSPILVGILALTLMQIVYMSESIRGALLSIDQGQYEAGYSVGLTTWQTLRRIIFPQVVPVAIPVLTSNIIGAMKASSIVMAIGVMDVLNGSLIPSQTTYSFLEGYVAAALIYWGITILIERAAKFLENRQEKYRRKLV